MDRPYARELPNKPWPAKGEIIDWSGKCFFSPEVIKRNIASMRPGVLFEKRPLLPFFNSDTGEVLPNTKITLARIPNYARPIYKGLVGDDKRVIVKFYPMPQNYDPSSPWAGIKAVNVDEHHLHYGLLREARAYEKLEHLQGSVVPHCYGFYEYSRVGCAPLIMQVLEDVEGLSLYGYMDRIRTARSHSQFIAVFRSYFLTLIELRKCGVLHRQALDRNVRIQGPMDDKLIRMIHLDFSASDVVNLPNLKEGERGNNIRPEHWVRPDVACLNKIINERGLCVDGLDKFVHTPEGMALLKRWATFPTAFTKEEREPLWYDPNSQEPKSKL